ncbi:32604_t:CDS:1, partial [Racocetra persica]
MEKPPSLICSQSTNSNGIQFNYELDEDIVNNFVAAAPIPTYS